jgi:hypothetical protein
VWLNRKGLAREALVGWLTARGVPAEAEVEAFGPGIFTARIRAGDPRAPDFAADRVTVRYAMKLNGIEVRAVRLERPVLRAAVRGGKLSVGALDPIVQAFLKRPPRPDVRKPRIDIEGGRLFLASDYGPVTLTANARVEDGKLMALSALAAPARLKGPGFETASGPASLNLVTRGGTADVRLDAPLPLARAGEATLTNGRLSLLVQAPYPDLVKRRGDGGLVVRATLSGRDLALAGRRFAHADLTTAFTGQTRGWIADLAVTGRATADLRADGGEISGARISRVRAAGAAEDVRWTRAGGDRVSARVQLTGTGEGVTAGDLQLAVMTVAAGGPVTLGRGGVSAQLSGSAVGQGGWSGLGAPVPADGASVIAIKRAARGFRLAAPEVALAIRDGAMRARLPQPVRLIPDTGGAVTLAARGQGFRLTSAGGGLPAMDAEVTRLELAPGGATAVGRVRAKLSAGPAIDAELDASGRLRLADGVATFAADRCIPLKAARLEFGANDVEALSGRFCPTKEPLFRFAGGDWRATGRVEAGAASVPFTQTRVTDGAGTATFASRGGRLTAQAQIASARLTDTAPSPRFNPLTAQGRATLSNFVWTADADLSIPGGRVARAHLVHDTGIGVGFLTLSTGELRFAEGGLQPDQLSPAAAAVGSPATGAVTFDGRFDWAQTGVGSRGALSIPGLDFQSPAGRVEGLKGQIAFTSLAPLAAAAGQTLTIAKVDAIVPLTDLQARFSLANEVLTIAGGEAAVGGGKVRIESLEVPLTPGGATRGVLFFDGVQLHDLIEASPFGDKVELDARVSGRVPFERVDNRVRITGGDLKAIEPGRLSINRTALSGVKANGEAQLPTTAPDPNATFTDFAYQAMENLAFDTLEAAIASRPDGRLGVLFHIVGRHDPPTKQQIRLGLMDLIQRRFMGRKLPLPSGTQVNLTLDTSLNLDDLLSDYADYRRLHGSGGVQP